MKTDLFTPAFSTSMNGQPFFRPGQGASGWGLPAATDRSSDFDFRAGVAAPRPATRHHDQAGVLPPGWLA